MRSGLVQLWKVPWLGSGQQDLVELYLKSCIKIFIDSGAVMFVLFSFSLLAIGGQPLASPPAAGSCDIAATGTQEFLITYSV